MVLLPFCRKNGIGPRGVISGYLKQILDIHSILTEGEPYGFESLLTLSENK